MFLYYWFCMHGACMHRPDLFKLYLFAYIYIITQYFLLVFLVWYNIINIVNFGKLCMCVYIHASWTWGYTCAYAVWDRQLSYRHGVFWTSCISDVQNNAWLGWNSACSRPVHIHLFYRLSVTEGEYMAIIRTDNSLGASAQFACN